METNKVALDIGGEEEDDNEGTMLTQIARFTEFNWRYSADTCPKRFKVYVTVEEVRD